MRKPQILSEVFGQFYDRGDQNVTFSIFDHKLIKSAVVPDDLRFRIQEYHTFIYFI